MDSLANSTGPTIQIAVHTDDTRKYHTCWAINWNGERNIEKREQENEREKRKRKKCWPSLIWRKPGNFNDWRGRNQRERRGGDFGTKTVTESRADKIRGSPDWVRPLCGLSLVASLHILTVQSRLVYSKIILLVTIHFLLAQFLKTPRSLKKTKLE